MIKVNLVAWKNKTEAAKRKIRSSATSYVQSQVTKVLKDALRVSPQWSGTFAYNWTVEYTGYSAVYSTRFKVEPYWKLRGSEKQAGHPEAIKANLSDQLEVIERIKWNHKVRLVNHAPVAELIETGQVKLRPENKIPGNVGVIAYLKQKYRIVI